MDRHFIMVNNICATSYKNRIQLFKNLFLDLQNEVCFSKPFNLCSGWISVRLWVAGWLDDGYGPQAQRWWHHRHRLGCGADEVHLPRSYRSLQHPSAPGREDLCDCRAASWLQWGGGNLSLPSTNNNKLWQRKFNAFVFVKFFL